MEQDFNNFAEEYRQIHTANVQAVSGVDSYYFAEYKVKELLPFETNARLHLLDLGCGDGATAFFMQRYLPLIQITGIDVSDKSIEVAKRRGLTNVVFSSFNGTAIPFAESSFDIVFIAGVLHHISSSTQQQLMGEIFRVLKPCGRLYVFEHNPLNPFTRYLVRTCSFDEGVTLLKSNTCNRLIKGAGLAVLEKRFTIFFPRKYFFLKLLWLEKYLRKLPFGGQYYIRAVKP